MSQVSTPQQVFEVDGDILLRTAEPTDAYVISQYFVVNRAHLKPWEPERDAEFFTLSGWTSRLIKLNELHRLGLGYYLVIIDRETEQMLGTISFSTLTRFPVHACHVGYSLANGAQGRGVMSRALKMAVDYMFNVQNMHRIMASYMPHNLRSEAVLERLGFEREGLSKQSLLINGQWRDHILTAMINHNWTPVKK